ncbi:unnamed protein product [Plutella xylostella]|uniref:(diamondback moth) hypothetical protein n=1 Tax=Plutella xylostella TaxID=51655 RepID=A0A8S4D7D5_PLUXY|nr:unnamed protein product [Plutella xylostella]
MNGPALGRVCAAAARSRVASGVAACSVNSSSSAGGRSPPSPRLLPVSPALSPRPPRPAAASTSVLPPRHHRQQTPILSSISDKTLLPPHTHNPPSLFLSIVSGWQESGCVGAARAARPVSRARAAAARLTAVSDPLTAVSAGDATGTRRQ